MERALSTCRRLGVLSAVGVLLAGARPAGAIGYAALGGLPKAQLQAQRRSSSARSATTVAERHGDDSRPTPVTRRPRAFPGLLAGREGDGPGRRRAPESRTTLATTFRAWRAGRIATLVFDRHPLAPAAVFHDAHAPPARLSAAAGGRS